MKRLAHTGARITGASKSIGASIAEHFTREGAAVGVNDANRKSDTDSHYFRRPIISCLVFTEALSIAPNARNVVFCASVTPRIPVILSRS